MLEYPFKYLQQEINISVNPSFNKASVEGQLCISDLERYSTLNSAQKQHEFLWSRAAVNQSGAVLNEIFYNGKKPCSPQGFISLSHCSSGVASCFSNALELGIDIETRRPSLPRIGHKFTQDREIELFDCDAQDALQFIWGIKESLFKLYGYGSVDFKEHLQITSFQWDEATKRGWGTAWITQTCDKRPAPIQCLVQTAKVDEFYLCMASHRAPMTAIETPRTLLREWEPKDAEWLFKLNTNLRVIKYTGDAGFTSKNDALELIKTYPNYQRDGYGRWMVILKESQQPIGWCGLKKNRWGIDLGFRFFEHTWGQGLATECATATISKAKDLNLSRLIGRALSENTASWNVLEKVGMKRCNSQPIEEFAKDFPIAEKDLKQWSGQALFMYKIDVS